MKAPTHFAALSALTGRDFKKQAVITPKHRFDFYDEGQKCNVTNWSSEYQVHVYHTQYTQFISSYFNRGIA